MRLPVVTAATAGAPSEPTTLVPTKPTSDASRFVMIAGQASCQIPSAGPVVRCGAVTASGFARDHPGMRILEDGPVPLADRVEAEALDRCGAMACD